LISWEATQKSVRKEISGTGTARGSDRSFALLLNPSSACSRGVGGAAWELNKRLELGVALIDGSK